MRPPDPCPIPHHCQTEAQRKEPGGILSLGSGNRAQSPPSSHPHPPPLMTMFPFWSCYEASLLCAVHEGHQDLAAFLYVTNTLHLLQ